MQELFENAAKARLQVVRIWASNLENQKNIQIGPGVYDEDMMRGAWQRACVWDRITLTPIPDTRWSLLR